MLSTLIPVFLLARLDNIYILLLVITMVWMGIIGWIDDYIKIFKKNKAGLKGKFKVIGQVLLGIFVGSVLYLNERVTVRINISPPSPIDPAWKTSWVASSIDIKYLVTSGCVTVTGPPFLICFLNFLIINRFFWKKGGRICSIWLSILPSPYFG